MPTVTIVSGLPASGKSTYSRKLAKERGNLRLFDEVAAVYFHEETNGLMSLIEHLRSGQDCVVNESTMVLKPNRELICQILNATVAGLIVEWHVFELNITQCLKNAELDKTRSDLSLRKMLIQRWGMEYTRPNNCTVLPVVDAAEGSR